MNKSAIRQDIKFNAKRMLCGNWGAAIGIMFINIGIQMVIMMVANAVMFASVGVGLLGLARSVSSYATMEVMDVIRVLVTALGTGILLAAVELFLVFPISFGIYDWYFQLSKGNKQSVSNIFNYFGSGKLYIRAIKTSLEFTVKIILWSLAFVAAIFICIFGIVMLGAALKLAIGTAAAAVIVPLTIIVYIASFIGLMLITYRYTLIIYSSVRNPDWKNREIFYKSTKYMKGHIGETFVFDLSFFGWYLLSAITCGIVMIYLEPYYLAAQMLYMNYIYEGGEAAEGDYMPGAAPYTPNNFTPPAQQTDSTAGTAPIWQAAPEATVAPEAPVTPEATVAPEAPVAPEEAKTSVCESKNTNEEAVAEQPNAQADDAEKPRDDSTGGNL